MGISIRDPEVSELARELAKLRKTNMTEAIAHALRSELKRERDKRPLRERWRSLRPRADETVPWPAPIRGKSRRKRSTTLWGQ